jgi:kynurenine 3-monooxygenase
MRDKTASKTFRAKKKLDHLLDALLPGIYLPLYTMVTFTRIPYAEAARRGRRQDRIVYGGISATIMLILLLSKWSPNSHKQRDRHRSDSPVD